MFLSFKNFKPFEFFVFIFILSIDFIVSSKQITVHNKSPYDIFVATYYGKRLSTQSLKKYSSIVPVISGQSNKVDLPPIVWDLSTNRLLVYSAFKNRLLDLLTHEQQKLLKPIDIGKSPSDNFYVTLDKGHLQAYSAIDYILLNPITSKLGLLRKEVVEALWFKSARAKYRLEPYSSMPASVRIGKDLSPEENLFIRKRLSKLKQPLENFLNQNLTSDELPRIAICGSGGGYRAMIATLGSLIGAQKIGLLDCTLYISALSGSTWLLSQWLTSNNSLLELKSNIITKINKQFISALLRQYKSIFLNYIIQKYAFIQGVSVIDIYGAILASNLLTDTTISKNPLDIYLNNQIKYIENGDRPFPIYTAIVTKQPYEWVEFNPYEIGSDYLGGYIPSWSLGRRFFKGQSEGFESDGKKLFAPPLPLGYLMGIWGSALSVNLKELWLEVLKDLVPTTFLPNTNQQTKNTASSLSSNISKFTAVPINMPILRYLNLRAAIEKTFEESLVKGVRFLPAQVYNFTYGLINLPRGEQKRLTLVDAGIDFNLPLPPLLKPERKIDLIIVLDASGGATIGKELQKTEEHFKARGMSFPKVDYSKIQTNICNVFKDNDPQTPTVIYLPLIANPNYSTSFDPKDCLDNFCSTFNFVYSKEEFNLLSGLTEFNMIQSKDCIVNTLKKVVETKRKIKAGKLKEYAKLMLLQKHGKA